MALKFKIIKQTKDEIELEEITDSRFIDCGDGTIKDTKTNLMWPKDGSEERMEYEDAEKYCKKLNIGGHKDWRLPTREELEGILDLEKYDPAINPVFNAKSEYYWTCTPFANDSDGAWIVYFGGGYVSWGYRSSGNYVRAVRQY